jgi:hypothetical protein
MAEKEEVCIPVQLDGSVGTTPKRIDGLKSGKYVEFYIENTSSNILYLSMDGGQHWKAITTTQPNGGALSIKGTATKPLLISQEDWKLKGSASGTTFEIIALKIVKTE